MSYILDALKKSEREKTLGKVPTLETVISDGGKKPPPGTPWWVNLLIFLGVLLTILAIMYFAGLINLDTKKESFSNSSGSAQNSKVQTQMNQSEAVTQTATETVEQPAAVQQQNIAGEEAQEIAEPVILAEPEPQQTVGAAAGESVTEIEEITAAQQVLAQQEAEEQAAVQQSEAVEIPVSANQVELVVQQQVQAELSETPQSANNDYEEALHQKLRSVAVNVVSYSSEARQRFVMLDLTIFKEGDSLPNGAEIIEIQRAGAVVEFENKRYLLKP